jgi:hypothetical protein
MREVQTTAARKQKLSAHRGHGIEQVDLVTQFGQDFSRHEACRSSADNGNFK